MIIRVNYRPTIPLQTKKILVIEREPEVRQIVRQLLEIEGYLVYEAQDGEAAMKALQLAVPDLIITDIDPSDWDNHEFYRAVRQNPFWVSIPLIFLSTGSTLDNIRSSREMGVDDYITKPVNPPQLVRVIHARLLRSAEIQVAHMNQAYLETVTMLARVVEGRDPYTHGHIERVVRYARGVAKALSWPGDRINILELGARLHDLGKVVVRDDVLKKTGPLSPQEWVEMKRHPIAGAKMLGEITYLRETIPYVLHHHERWDGTGYPKGLKGRDIPIEGRIMAIADVYDALTTHRPYHPARASREVLEYLKLRAGVLFDPELVDVFLYTLGQAQQKASLLRGADNR
jgi:putative two-component system response regulator